MKSPDAWSAPIISWVGVIIYVSTNGSYGLRVANSSLAYLHRNTITANSGGGVNIFSNSNVTAYGADTTKGRNQITGNTGVGVYASSSLATFGIAPNGHNWIQNNSSYEAQQVGAGYQIRAENCYWGGGSLPPNEASGNVDASPYITTVPNPVGWGKSPSYDPTYLIVSPPGTITETPPVGSDYSSNGSLAKSEAPATSVTSINWTQELKAAIEDGLNTGNWNRAGELLTELLRELQDARVPDVDFVLVNGYANRFEVAPFIRKMLAMVLVENDKVGNNLSAALAKLAVFSQNNKEHAAEFGVNAGLIHLYGRNDLIAAQNVFGQLQAMAQNGDANAVEHVNLFGMILQDYQRHRQNAGLAKPIPALTEAPAIPATSTLAQNYPNPFNPETTIRFHLNERRQVRLVIYDLTGHRVCILVDGELAAEEHTISWDGRDQFGRDVASGIYFYELLVGNKVERRKMTLVR